LIYIPLLPAYIAHKSKKAFYHSDNCYLQPGTSLDGRYRPGGLSP
jgi:hypothetical protein